MVGEQMCITALENNLTISQKTGNNSTSRPKNATPGHMPRKCATTQQSPLLNYVHIHNNLNQETT